MPPCLLVFRKGGTLFPYLLLNFNFLIMILDNTIKLGSYVGRKFLQGVTVATPTVRATSVKVVNAVRKESALAKIEAKTQAKLLGDQYEKCKKVIAEERDKFTEGISAKLVLPGTQPATA